jgi:tetratricopeptide (TPR) repeat protein
MTYTIVAHAQWELEPSLDSIVVNGIDCIYRQEYIKADSIFRNAVERYPQHPAGYLYQVGVMQQYAIDFSVPIERNKFDSLLVLGKNTAKNLDAPWLEYFLGSAEGYDAYERIEREDWLNGVRKGMSSASWFEEVIENDSSFYDAYVGVGTYYYWSSRKTAFIRWLPFVKDKRELGIKMLILCAERSKYNRFAAISALISTYIDAEDYTQAETWSRRGLKYYPKNRIFLWGLATALERNKHYTETVAVYENLLKNILSVKSPHPYNEIVCRLKLVKLQYAVNDTVTALQYLKTILSYENIQFPASLESRAKPKFEEARNLLLALGDRSSVLK